MDPVAQEHNLGDGARGYRPAGLSAADTADSSRWLEPAVWWGSACLAGPAQILFSSRPLTGAWLIFAIALLSPPHALGLAIGLLTTTALATYARWNRILLSRGLFGLNGALVGLVWPEIFPIGSSAFWLVIPASAVTLTIQARLLPSFTQRDLPVLTVPFILTIWGSTLLGLLFGAVRPQILAPIIAGPLAGWGDPGLRNAVAGSLMTMAPGLIALAASAALASRAALKASLIGVAVGLSVALTLGGLKGFYWVGSYGYSAAPLMLAIAGTFFPWNRRSLEVGALAAALSVLVWVGTVWAISPLGLFPLTLPLNGILLGLLLLERSRAGKTVLGLPPIPLDEVGVPKRRFSAPRADDQTLSTLETLIQRASSILVLTGAGVSTESRIPDYRSQIGFWFDANAEDLTYDRFLSSEYSQWLYWRLQRRFFEALERAAPNQTHESLVNLEFRGKLLGIVTQNVDGLHQRAGSSPNKVVELHGTAHEVVCLGCGARFRYADIRKSLASGVPSCERCGGVLKVDVVSIGEPIPPERVRQAWEWCQKADLLLVLGTSLLVEPAASLPAMVGSRGVAVVIVNRSQTPFDLWATLIVRAPLGVTWAELERRFARPARGYRIRPMTRQDFLFLGQVVDSWWGDSVRHLLHPLFLEHFGETCFVLESGGELAGFLIGVRSQSRPGEAYVHLVSTAPPHRGRGFGRALYEHFFERVARHGCHRVSAITVPYNAGSLAFHRRMGFTLREAGASWQGNLPVAVNYAGLGVDCVLMDREIAPKTL